MTTLLPDVLAQVIARGIEPFPIADLRDLAQSLSSGYRTRHNIRSTLSPIGVAAYLGARFPSTFAVADRVWSELGAAIDMSGITSVLDAGAGPGTASWAAHALLPSARYTLLERDMSWRNTAIAFGETLGARVQFQQGSLDASGAMDRHDAVVACYSLNELGEAQRAACISRLWRAATKLLIVIEPGTPLGFGVVREVRDLVIAEGGHVVAPCTHSLACPMTAGDWCHFPVRVQRLAIQRSLKDAELGYEDEKFSYVVLSRAPVDASTAGRVIRKPIRAKGHLHLDACVDGAITRHTLSKKHGDLYRAAKDTDWGDLWPVQPL
jgi:ribosomal protein RSM22 (predicted rRNA methylase)